MGRDAAEYTEASYTTDFSSACDSPEDELREISSRYRDTVDVVRVAHEQGILERLGYATDANPHELIRRILMFIGDDSNAGLKVWCLDYLCGTGIFSVKTETQIGLRWGCTRSNVSKIVKTLQGRLGLPAAPGGKRNEVSEVYRARAKRNHVEGKIRKVRLNWSFAARFEFAT